MMYDYAFGFGPHFFWGGILPVLFWVFIIVLVVALVRQRGRLFHGGRCGHGSCHDALEILRERYARGEIDKAEYEERKKTLSS